MTRHQTIAALGCVAVLVGMGQAVAWHRITTPSRPVCHVRSYSNGGYLVREAWPADADIMRSDSPDELIAFAAKIGCEVKP